MASHATAATWVGASETELALACAKAGRALLAGPPGPWAFVRLGGVESLVPLVAALGNALSRLQGLPVKIAIGTEARAWLIERTSGDAVGPRGVLTLLDLGDAPAEDLPNWSSYVGRFVVVGRRQHSNRSELAHVKKFLPPTPVPGFLMTD